MRAVKTLSVPSTPVEATPPAQVQDEAFSEDDTKADGKDELLEVAVGEGENPGEDIQSDASGGDDLKDPDYVEGALKVAMEIKKKRAAPKPKASTKKHLVAVSETAGKTKRKKKDDQIAVMVPMDQEDANSKLINRKTLELAESKIKEHSQWYPFGLNKYYEIPERLIDNPLPTMNERALNCDHIHTIANLMLKGPSDPLPVDLLPYQIKTVNGSNKAMLMDLNVVLDINWENYIYFAIIGQHSSVAAR
ncbi:unnamed protein product [Calypogeia fissa]